MTEASFSHLLQIFPCPDIQKTAHYYEKIGFRSVSYLNSAEPHICLYRDTIELILTQSSLARIFPNRTQYGYGYDAYFITEKQAAMQQEFVDKGITLVRPLMVTDYGNKEFVFEDIDGRWIAVGNKMS
ncbi:VOC family protein [Terribacillus saccharophilus]|uniref:Glyoxalase n=1 Tax=Terribacillus saccharophilus TaxID=361277 RepID=A0A075LL06_9BACI|nr:MULTISPECIES: VOC family protein [Terribacillus]AIF67445.1 glyoxalase [Terribacillus goriensis]MCM3225820.1 glyoxalase [Terribacillus saccharophilus]MEC0281477.1 glyoxalase [Terribacillus saccharophilus]MEC0291737.1 glyoxalase [Terribacillus saccharophilus]